MEITFEWDEFKAIANISASGRVLVLTYTERQDKIRIISCRKATAREREFYEEGSF